MMTSINELDLRKFAKEHVLYEYNMLIYTANYLLVLSNSNSNDISNLLKNSLLESYCIHLRNLIAFVYSSIGNSINKYKTDIDITDYVDIDTVREGTPSFEIEFKPVWNKINKQLAHLTEERKYEGDDEKSWNYIEISTKILGVFSKLISMADKQKMDDETKQSLATGILYRLPLMIDVSDNYTVTLSINKSHDY